MPTQPTPGAYTLDPIRSSVRFQHKSMWGLANVKGTFGTVRGSGTVAENGTGSGTLVIDAASLDTKNSRRDTHLRSKDFFEVETFPEITFDAKKISNAADGSAQVEGELTVRDTSRELTFPARYEAQGADSLVLRGEIDIDRRHYGISWNQFGMAAGAAKIELELVFSAAR
jgi:polyisoprenoid-binding protein YceI